jgi:hypothetical protein
MSFRNSLKMKQISRFGGIDISEVLDKDMNEDEAFKIKILTIQRGRLRLEVK